MKDGVLQRTEATRGDAFGFANIFFKPTDLNGNNWGQLPYIVAGLPLKGQALHSPVVGFGKGISSFGLNFDIYAGVQFNRTSITNDMGGTDVRWVRKLSVGLNIPVGRFLKTYLSKAK